MINSTIKLPIVFGVTGHRDIRNEDIPYLEKVVSKELNRAKKRYKHSELIVLSALAEGADRLVARVALADGFRLIVPLPMPIDEYKKDFTTQSSKDEFDFLLSKAAWHYALPLVEGNTFDNIRPYGEPRDKQYAQLGAYIAQESHFLLALWDGIPLTLLGGTSYIVRYKLQQEKLTFPMPDSPLDYIESGPVFHIMTPRQGRPLPAEKRQLFKLRKIYPIDWGRKPTEPDSDQRPQPNNHHRQQRAAEKMYRRKINNIDKYNRDAEKISHAEPEKIEQSKVDLIRDLQLREEIGNDSRHFFEHYAVADALAIKARDKKIGLFDIFFNWQFLPYLCLLSIRISFWKTLKAIC